MIVTSDMDAADPMGGDSQSITRNSFSGQVGSKAADRSSELTDFYLAMPRHWGLGAGDGVDEQSVPGALAIQLAAVPAQVVYQRVPFHR